MPTLELSHLTPVQRRAYVLSGNRLALSAGWDDELLRLELAELGTKGFDLALAGFEQGEITSPLTKPTAGLTDLAEIPPRPRRPVNPQPLSNS